MNFISLFQNNGIEKWKINPNPTLSRFINVVDVLNLNAYLFKLVSIIEALLPSIFLKVLFNLNDLIQIYTVDTQVFIAINWYNLPTIIIVNPQTDPLYSNR